MSNNSQKQNGKPYQGSHGGSRAAVGTRTGSPSNASKYKGMKDRMVLSTVAKAMCDQGMGEDGKG